MEWPDPIPDAAEAIVKALVEADALSLPLAWLWELPDLAREDLDAALQRLEACGLVEVEEGRNPGQGAVRLCRSAVLATLRKELGLLP